MDLRESSSNVVWKTFIVYSKCGERRREKAAVDLLTNHFFLVAACEQEKRFFG